MEYIWFVEFDFAADGQLQQCRVTPHFPVKGATITDNVLCPLAAIDTSERLADLLTPSPTPGFVLLSRYTDTLAQIHALPLSPLQLRTEAGTILDLSQVQILAAGQHSLVLLPSPASNCVIKISLRALIDRERRVHEVVDGSSANLRKMIAGPGGYGVVSGCGDGLAFLILDGLGSPFAASHAATDAAFASLWEQARAGLLAMHNKRVLHRDVKPSNMIIVHGALLLNDFDIACSLDDERELQLVQVGTRDFHSPKLKDKWRARDDLLALVLSFLSLRMPFPFANKQGALDQARELAWIPPSMKACIEQCYK
jgi:hypothetical protein